ncbi:MAG: toxin-antitoxin system protein [Bacillota bacterium]|nr:toxin-antitoxin system protein [Bacillota bacterium]
MIVSSTNVRIYDRTYKIINEIASQTGKSKQEILDKAVEEYRRKQFLIEANKAYAALKNNTEKWQEEIKEREEWDVTLEDGLRDGS